MVEHIRPLLLNDSDRARHVSGCRSILLFSFPSPCFWYSCIARLVHDSAVLPAPEIVEEDESLFPLPLPFFSPEVDHSEHRREPGEETPEAAPSLFFSSFFLHAFGKRHGVGVDGDIRSRFCQPFSFSRIGL